MSAAVQASRTGARYESLDALRGVAALLVLTFHCAQVFPGFAQAGSPLSLASWSGPWPWLKYTPLRLFVSSGPPAVVVFFILSGFVLSLPFLRGGAGPSYVAFAAKRLCRIVPPFAAAVLLSAALYAWLRPAPIAALSDWFNSVLWDQPLSARYVARNLLMTGLPADMTLDRVMWSLVHELRISLIFPLLFVLARRWPVGTLAGSMLLGILCTQALGGADATDAASSLIDTGRFVVLFVAGIVMAANVGAVRRGVGRLPGPVCAMGWIAAVGLLMAPGPSLWNYYDYGWGAGAALLLALTVGSARAARVFAAAPLVWLGRVSYSLYLIHVPVLVATVHLAYGAWPLATIVAVGIALSLLGAEAMYRLMEVPSIRLGRLLAARAAPGRAALVPTPALVSAGADAR